MTRRQVEVADEVPVEPDRRGGRGGGLAETPVVGVTLFGAAKREDGMEDPENQRSDVSKMLEVVVAAATIVAGIAAVAALKDKGAIIATGVIGGLILGVLAIHALGRGDKGSTGALGGIATVVVLAAATYGLSTSADGVPQPWPSQQRQAGTPQGQTTPSTPTTQSPVFEGTAEMAAGQAIDLETTSSKAKSVTGVLAKPDDVRVDQYAFAFDRDGYLLSYTGNPRDGREGCKELLEPSRPRQPVFALPGLWYCAVTSEDRIALIQFGEGDIMGRIGNLSYRVWNN